MKEIINYTDCEEKLEEIKFSNIRVAMEGRGRFLYDSVFIDLNGGCNFRCGGCFKGMNVNQPRDRLTYDEVIDITDFAQKRGARAVVYAGVGEPMLDKDFWKLIGHAYDVGMGTVLFTNGTNVTGDGAKILYEKSVSVIIKINTLDKSKQDALVGNIEGAHKDMWRGLHNLLAAGFRSPRLAVDSYISKKNAGDLPELLRFCRKSDIIPHFESFITKGQDLDNIIGYPLSQEEFDNLFIRFSKIDKDEFGILTRVRDGARVYGLNPCIKNYTAFSVRVNGDVALCVSDNFIIGNIRKQTLEDILNPNNELIRDAYKTVCRCSKVTSCEVEKRCHGT